MGVAEMGRWISDKRNLLLSVQYSFVRSELADGLVCLERGHGCGEKTPVSFPSVMSTVDMQVDRFQGVLRGQQIETAIRSTYSTSRRRSPGDG